MSLWRQLTRGLRGLAKPSAADQDVADEVQHYTEQAIADLTARGLSQEAARRAVQLEIGSATIVREHVRASGWENPAPDLLLPICVTPDASCEIIPASPQP